LKEINVTEEVWIDERMFSIRIIEDVEFGFDEDACLVDGEDDNNSQCSVPEGFQEDDPLVEAFVQQLKDDWVLKTNEGNKSQSDTVNQHSSTGQPEMAHLEVEKNPRGPILSCGRVQNGGSEV